MVRCCWMALHRFLSIIYFKGYSLFIIFIFHLSYFLLLLSLFIPFPSPFPLPLNNYWWEGELRTFRKTHGFTVDLGIVKASGVSLYFFFFLLKPWNILSFCHSVFVSVWYSLLLFLHSYCIPVSICTFLLFCSTTSEFSILYKLYLHFLFMSFYASVFLWTTPFYAAGEFVILTCAHFIHAISHSLFHSVLRLHSYLCQLSLNLYNISLPHAEM